MMHRKNLRRFVAVVVTAAVQTDSKNILCKGRNDEIVQPQMSEEHSHLSLPNCESQRSTDVFICRLWKDVFSAHQKL